MCCMVTARKVEGQIPHSIVRGSSFYFWREGTRPLAPPMWPSNDTCYNWELVKVLTVHLASSDLSQQGGRDSDILVFSHTTPQRMLGCLLRLHGVGSSRSFAGVYWSKDPVF